MFELSKRGHVATLTISRPETLNALDSAALNELYEVCTSIRADKSIRCLIITGVGKSFVAGADISEMMNLDEEGGYSFGMLGHRAFCELDALPMPVIAAINGYALGGGCELCLCADIRVAGERAKFGQPETGLGITPGFGGTQRLSRAVGRANAAELIFTGRVIDANEAERIGLVNRVVPQDKLMDEVNALANAIAANAPIAVRNSKRSIRLFTDNNLFEDLNKEADLFGSCFNTEDQKMAMSAFVNKAPKGEFKGK